MSFFLSDFSFFPFLFLCNTGERRKQLIWRHDAGLKKTKTASDAAVICRNDGSIEREGSAVYTAVIYSDNGSVNNALLYSVLIYTAVVTAIVTAVIRIKDGSAVIYTTMPAFASFSMLPY